MQPWTFLEHACEVLGVFLLSVEAIKLNNFRRLNDRLLKPLLRFINPAIEFVDEPGRSSGPDLVLTLLLLLLPLVGFGLLLAVSHLWAPSAAVLRPWLWRSFGWLATLGLLAGYVLCCLLTALMVYTVAVALLTCTTKALERLEEATERGIVGLMGFALYLVYFILKTTSS